MKPALLHRSLHELPHSVLKAFGMNLQLADGRTIIDACGGAAVVILGHGNREVIAAAANQMTQVSYVHTGAYTAKSAENLAHELLDNNPYHLAKALFVGSGKSHAFFWLSELFVLYRVGRSPLPPGGGKRILVVCSVRRFYASALRVNCSSCPLALRASVITRNDRFEFLSNPRTLSPWLSGCLAGHLALPCDVLTVCVFR